MQPAIIQPPCLAAEALALTDTTLNRARRSSAFECFDGVLGRPPLPSPTAVPNDEGRRRPDTQAASSSAMERAKAFASSTRSAGREIAPTTGCPPPPWRSQMAAILCRRGTRDHGLYPM